MSTLRYPYSRAARGRGDALGDFLLRQEHAAPHHGAELHHPFENRSGRIVGQVTGDHRGSPLGEIDLQGVALHHLEAGTGRRKRLGHFLRQIAIDFDGDDAIGVGQQVSGESPAARADLDDQRLPIGTGGARNTLQDRGANQEMLAKLLARHRQPRTT